MRHFIFILLCSINFGIFAQVSDYNYFAQCLFEISDQEKVKELEAEIRNHPSLEVVRLDVYSNRAFILGKRGVIITESDLKSWFKEYSDQLKCIQIGVHGIDKVNPFPFVNCK